MTGRSFEGKCYWIVGASDGLGEALAQELSGAGASLVLSARRREKLEAVGAALPGVAHIAPCDVRDPDSVIAALDGVPPIDGLVYCAGLYEPTGAEDWDMKSVEAMCDVNFTGAARVLGAAMPGLAARGGGHIVLIGSLAGLKGLPNATGYGASKAGVIHMAENLRADLDPEAFTVQLMNPGFIRTRLTDKNSFSMPFLMEPEEAARRVVKAMRGRRFRTAFPMRLAAIIRTIGMLPDGLYFRLSQAA